MATIAALLRLYGAAPLRWLAVTYVEIFRGTSALVQLFWLFFVLPQFGISMEPFTVAVLGLGLNVGAYGAEVVRGAIQGVQRGQWEATTALNMTRWQVLRRIILPQAFVAMIPPWGNLFIELLKSTALVSLITLSDLAFRAQELNETTMQDHPDLHPWRCSCISRCRSSSPSACACWSRASMRGMVRGGGVCMIWNWGYALEILPILAHAAIVTIEATFIGFRHRAGAGPASWRCCALAARLVRRGRISAFVELIRSTPLLIQIFFIYLRIAEFRHRARCLHGGNHGTRPPLRLLLLGGLPRRARSRAARPVGSMHCAQSQLLDHVQGHHPSAGDSADRAGAWQLSGRAFQGDAAALGHRGSGTGADGKEHGHRKPSATPSR